MEQERQTETLKIPSTRTRAVPQGVAPSSRFAGLERCHHMKTHRNQGRNDNLRVSMTGPQSRNGEDKRSFSSDT